MEDQKENANQQIEFHINDDETCYVRAAAAVASATDNMYNTVFYLVKMLIANISFLVYIRSSMNSIIQILPTHFLVLISIHFEKKNRNENQQK